MQDSARWLTIDAQPATRAPVVQSKASRIYDGVTAPDHQRVGIVARETAGDGVQTLRVMQPTILGSGAKRSDGLGGSIPFGTK